MLKKKEKNATKAKNVNYKRHNVFKQKLPYTVHPVKC